MKKEEILEDIKSRILSGEIAPGVWITERELCERYGISRTPVREIIWNLTRLNLVEVETDKGCRVRKFSINDIIEVYNAREAVEGESARLACLCTDSDYLQTITDLEEKLNNLKASDDVAACVRYGNAVHRFILEKSGNRYLQAFSGQIYAVTGIIRNITQEYISLEENSRLAHLEILAALKKRDGQTASRAMRQHLHQTCKNIVSQRCSNLLGCDDEEE